LREPIWPTWHDSGGFRNLLHPTSEEIADRLSAKPAGKELMQVKE
jgi:hypothetical protein